MIINNFSNFLNERNIRGYWTRERCREEALKYNSRNELRKNNPLYSAIKRNKWLDDVCNHMTNGNKKSCYWTFENCQKEALKYNNRTDFYKKSRGAYLSSVKNGWYKEICSHMIQFRTEYFGYAYEFEDNSVYVGITSREKQRIRSHLKDKTSSVFNHISSTGLKPTRKLLFELTNSEDASILEGWWINYYKERGWNILNIAKPGSLGGTIIKWTKEKCREDALKYKTRSEFKMNSLAYDRAWKNNWLDEICSHMKSPIKPMRYWTKEKCKEESLKYLTKNQFQHNSSSAYNVSFKNRWLDEFFPKRNN